jgi:hypothetical protein
MLKHRLITAVFITAGLVNIAGALTFTQGFRNTYIADLNPEVFSNVSAIGTMLWGLAYIAVARNYQQVRALVAVFALQKLVFFVWWVVWMLHKEMLAFEIYATSTISGIGLMSYGLVDLIFFFFFAWVWKVSKAGKVNGSSEGFEKPRGVD